MVVLSITQGHDTGASVVHQGKIIAAISEERYSRVKMDRSFPEISIRDALKIAGVTSDDVNVVVIPELKKSQDVLQNLIPQYPKNVFSGTDHRLDIGDRSKQLIMSSMLLIKTYSRMFHQYYWVENRIKKIFPEAMIYRMEHHLTHAAGAYYSSGFNNAIIVTADAWGDFVTMMISIGKEREIIPMSRSYYPNSLGHYYQCLTNWLGFIGGRHEGKVLGLAAYGDEKSVAYDMIKDMLRCNDLNILAPNMMGKMWHPKIPFPKSVLMRKLKNQFSREDISAVFQRRFEEVVTEIVRNCQKRFKMNNIVLAGGIFANVKLNQRIFEVDGIDHIFIFPHMGDGGVCCGGALYYDITRNGSVPRRLEDAYLGPEYSQNEIENALKNNGLKYQYINEIELKVARLIADEKVVARFKGRMEFGPRALGNRSILYQATDSSVNDWLNQRLGRSEFMPFAPVTLTEHANRCYKNIYGSEHTAKFMTITYDCTEYMKKISPAAIHVDGTARPQIIDKKTNPSYYKILKEYHRLTGFPSIINTSFNMHEEPIVCTPNDAIRAFKMGHLDYLAIGNFLAESNKKE